MCKRLLTFGAFKQLLKILGIDLPRTSTEFGPQADALAQSLLELVNLSVKRLMTARVGPWRAWLGDRCLT